MEDIKVKIIAESQVDNAKVDLGELLTITKGLIDATNQLNITNQKVAAESKKGSTEQIGLINKLQSEIQNLTRLRNESDSVSKIESYNSKLREQQAELNKLTTTQARSNVLTKEQSDKLDSLTATTKKTSSAFSNMAVTLGAFFAADRFIDMAKGAFNLAITTDSLDVALKNVSASTKEYNQSINFLNDITNRYGQQLVNLEGQYTQFIASSKSSNLTLVERNKIFESVIAAGSSLKLSNDKIEASLRAVSQMFSKGNVAAEELRGQLGEALPGAFGIMAKAMGVSETGLNKLLEQGKVLAADVLPKFANELNNLYGATAQNNVNTWTGASNRAYNSMTAWIVKQNESLGISDKMAKMANYVADNFEKIVNVVKSAITVFALYTANKIRANIVDQVKLINLGREILAKQAATATTIELTVAENAAAAAATRFNAALAASPWGLLMVAGVAAITMLLNYKDAQDNLIEAQGKLNKLVADALPDLVLEKNEFNSLAKSVLDTNLQKDERIKKLNILKDKFPEQLKGINSLSDAESNLGKVIRLTNQDFVTRAKLLENEVKIKYNNEIATKAIKEQILLENQLANASTNKTYMVTGTAGYVQAYDSEAEKIQKLIDKKKSLVINTQKANEDLAAYSEKLTKTVNYNLDSQLKKVEVKEEGQTKKEKAEQDKRDKQLAKALLKNEKDIEKHYENQLKIADKSFRSYLKAIESADDNEVKAKEKLYAQLRKELDAQFLYIESSNKLSEIRKAKSLDEIEAIEQKYAKRALDRLIKNTEDRLRVKESEYARLKSAGILDLESEYRLKEEISELKEDLNKLLTKLNDDRIKDASDTLKEESDIKNQTVILENRTLGELKKARNAFRSNEKLSQQLFGKELSQLNADELKALSKAVKDNQELIAKYIESALNFVSDSLDKLSSMLNEKLSNSSSLAEKESLVVGGKITDAFSSNVKGAAALMKGDLVGAAQGLFGYYKNIWDVTIGFNKTLDNIKREDFLQKFAESFGLISQYSDAIKESFDGLVNSSAELNDNTLSGAELIIKTQIDAANKIKEKYNLSVSEENDYHSKVISNIQSQLAAEIDAINSKYDYLNLKANLRFTADSLAISELMNQDLLSYVTNEDSKASLNIEYLNKRKFIYDTYASQIKPITEDMSEAEVAGINAAIKARDEQLARVESWLTTELEFIFSSEDQKRKTYSETDAIIQKGKDDLNELSIKYTAEELARNTSRNLELQTAETNKNLSLEAENKRYNDVLVLLATEKDAAIADSFNKLKDVITNGYAEMQAAAKKAYDDGLITAAEFEAAMQRIIYLKSLIDGSKSDVEIRVGEKLKDKGINLPGFHSGTEFVQGEKGYDKILAKIEYGEGIINAPLNAKKIKAGLTNESAINYAINYKSLLNDMPSLTIKPSIAGKIEERNAMQYLLNMNVNPVVDKLDNLEKVLSKLPIQTFNLDENGLTRYEQKGNSITIFKSKRLK